MSCVSSCCPCLQAEDSDAAAKKEQTHSFGEATSTPTSGCAFVKSSDGNNNVEDCSISERDIDDTVVIKQPRSVYSPGSNEEQRALMAKLSSDRDSDQSCSPAEVSDPLNSPAAMNNAKRPEKYLKRIPQQVCRANESQKQPDQDESIELVDLPVQNGGKLNLKIDSDEEPCQELLNLLQEVLRQRPPPVTTSDSKTIQRDPSSQEAELSSAELQFPVADPVAKSSNLISNEEVSEEIIMPSQHELNQELLEMLQTVYTVLGAKQNKKRPVSQANLVQPKLVKASVTAAEKRQLSLFEKQALEAHNYYRKHHGAPPLVNCPELQQRAQAWADYIASRDLQLLEPQDLDGQNWGCVQGLADSDEINGAAVVTGWYNQGRNYQFFSSDLQQGRTEKNNSATVALFEQLLWKRSERAGFGSAVSASGRVFVVARYRSPGRIPGEYAANVPPPMGGKMAPPFGENTVA